MTLTRDQLRTARMLLHLQQDALAELAEVGIATIKRFETGTPIRESLLTQIRGRLEKAGAVFIKGGKVSVPIDRIELSDSDVGDGVALKRKLPDATLARIEADRLREAGRIKADQARRAVHRSEPESSTPRRKGRPRKVPEDGSVSPDDDRG